MFSFHPCLPRHPLPSLFWFTHRPLSLRPLLHPRPLHFCPLPSMSFFHLSFSILVVFPSMSILTSPSFTRCPLSEHLSIDPFFNILLFQSLFFLLCPLLFSSSLSSFHPCPLHSCPFVLFAVVLVPSLSSSSSKWGSHPCPLLVFFYRPDIASPQSLILVSVVCKPVSPFPPQQRSFSSSASPTRSVSPFCHPKLFMSLSSFSHYRFHTRTHTHCLLFLVVSFLAECPSPAPLCSPISFNCRFHHRFIISSRPL